MFFQLAVGKAVGLEAADDDRGEQGVDARVTEAQPGGALAVHEYWLADLVEHGVTDDRVVTDRLGVEETPIGGEADLPQGGQVAQSLADLEVPGVVDGGLSTKGSGLLVILLDAGVLVLDVQRRGDSFGEDPGAIAARGG